MSNFRCTRLARRSLAALATVTALLGTLLVAAPAQSASPPWRAVLTFEKNQQSPSNSRMVWELRQRRPNGSWEVVETKSWRAGSGILGRAGRDSCATSKGWLPNGTYGIRLNLENRGRLIKGRAFRIDDKACPSGRVRRNLYLHTEQGAGNSQCRDRRGDQVCRWEHPRFNDYKSLGCIKMSPRDLAELAGLFRKHFAAGVRYGTDRVALRVVG